MTVMSRTSSQIAVRIMPGLMQSPNEQPIEGYIGVWGTPTRKDCYDTWFDRANPPELGLEFLPIPIFYGHGGDAAVGIKPIGKVIKAWTDNVGIKFRGLLDKTDPDFPRVYAELKKKILKTSSASSAHLAEFDDAGRFKKWFLSEVSLTDSPCEPTMPEVMLRRKPEIATTATAIDGPQGHEGGSERSNCGCDEKEAMKVRGNPMFNQPGTATAPALAAALGVQDRDDATAAPVRPIDQLLADPSVTPEELIASLIAAIGPEQASALFDSLLPDDANTPTTMSEQPVTPAAPVQRAMTQAEQVAALMARLAGSSPAQRVQRSAAPAVSDMVTLQRSVDALTRAMMSSTDTADVPTPPRNRSPQRQPAPVISNVRDMRYDHLTPDQAIMGARWWGLLNDSKVQSGHESVPIPENYMRMAATKLAKDMERSYTQPKDRYDAIRSTMPFTRSGEVEGSTVSGFGGNWIIQAYDNRLIEIVRQPRVYQEMLSRGVREEFLGVGEETIEIKLEGQDPKWVVTGQAADIDAAGTPIRKFSPSQIGTLKRNLGVNKLSASVFYTGELEEASIIRWVPNAQRQMDLSLEETTENIFFNGDVTLTANTNINLNDSTPTADAFGGMPNYTLFDGILKLPLVTNTAQAISMNASYTEDQFLKLMKLLGPDGKYALGNQDKVAFFMDNLTYFQMLAMSTLKNAATLGQTGTVITGEQMKIWNVPVFPSGFMGRATVNGLKSATAGNNVFGRVCLVRPDRWIVVYKRKATSEVQRWSGADTTEIVTHLRMGFGYVDTAAASAGYGIVIS